MAVERELRKPLTQRLNIKRPAIHRISTAFGPLLAFLGQRILAGLIILLFIIFLTHFGFGMARGEPLTLEIGVALKNTLQSARNLIVGDLGYSSAASNTLRPLPLAEVFPAILGRSMGLLGATLIFSSAVGVLLGFLGARWRRTGWSALVLVISIVGVSLPSFFAALLLQRIVIHITQTYGTRILPVGGFGWDAHLILPLLVLSARPIAQIARVTSNAIGEVIDQEYIRTAWSKGLSPPYVMTKHVLQNAAIPIATTIGVSMRFSLSSLPVVEAFFGWSGIGYYLLRGTSQGDDNLVVLAILALGGVFILLNILLDLVYRLIDPRLRTEGHRVSRGVNFMPLESLRAAFSSVRNFIRGSAFLRRIIGQDPSSEASPFRKILEMRGGEALELEDRYQKRRILSVVRSIIRNFPLLVGALIVLALVLLAVWGPRIAPHNPYATQGLSIEDGQLVVPPFEPDGIYPWGTDVLGRDIMSLILAGAWQTIRLAAVVVAARLMVGLILGALAGWFEGTWTDRSLMGLSEAISAFPTLLLAMLFILGLGIREGFMPFVIALCLVGWGEVMQYVRAEVIAMRYETFIESAVSVGRRLPGIISKHILPNLVPALVSLAALEMGAVLMLLGELGFVGIFIGGGAFAELDIDMPPYHYSDVPEWGALLSNVRLYAQVYPWTALYPSLAFFLAILGFNLFGEGLRKLITDAGVRLSQIFNRYTFAVAVAAMVGITWFRGSTGMLSIYQQQATAFDGEQAMKNVETLISESVEGRAIGTVGLDVTAEWIAMQFDELGVQPAGEDGSYFQVRDRDFQILSETPVLAVGDGKGTPLYRQDYVEYPAGVRNIGSALGPIRMVAVGDLTQVGWTGEIRAFSGRDYSGEILLALSSDQVPFLRRLPQSGMLVVADNPAQVQRRYTLSAQDPRYRIYGTGRDVGYDLPIFYITESFADRLLQATGHTVASLRERMDDLIRDEVMELPTRVEAAMDIHGQVNEDYPVRHVLGYWPGQAAAGQTKLDDHMVVVMAKYDTPVPPPEGEVPPGAVDNASGVGVMLEVIRIMKETKYEPNRTLLFVAYSGEGEEAGQNVNVPEVDKLLQAKPGFSTAFQIDAIINIRGLSSDSGEGLQLLTEGSLRLGNLFQDAARRFGVPAARGGEALDPSMIYQTGSRYDSGEEASRIVVTWEGWDHYSSTADDELSRVSQEQLEQSGRTLALAIMVAGRELQY